MRRGYEDEVLERMHVVNWRVKFTTLHHHRKKGEFIVSDSFAIGPAKPCYLHFYPGSTKYQSKLYLQMPPGSVVRGSVSINYKRPSQFLASGAQSSETVRFPVPCLEEAIGVAVTPRKLDLEAFRHPALHIIVGVQHWDGTSMSISS